MGHARQAMRAPPMTRVEKTAMIVTAGQTSANQEANAI
jgi:hypothetical protein